MPGRAESSDAGCGCPLPMSSERSLPPLHLLLGQAVRLWLRHGVFFLGISILAYGPATLIALVICRAAAPGSALAAEIGTGIAALLADPFVAALCLYRCDAASRGGETSFIALSARALRRWPIIFLAALLVYLKILAGLILLVVPGLYAYVCYSLAVPIAAFESGWPSELLQRSKAIVRSRFWYTVKFVVLFLVWGMILEQLISWASPTDELWLRALANGAGQFFWTLSYVAFYLYYRILTPPLKT